MLKAFGKDFVIYGLSASIGKFIALFLVPLYTRIFSPENYGIIDIISAVVAMSAILGVLQLESAVSRYYYAEKNEHDRNRMIATAVWSVLALSVFIFLLLFIFSDQLSFILFDSYEYSKIIVIAGITIPLTNLSNLFTVIVRFKKKPLLYLFFQSLQIGVSVGITIWLVVYWETGIIGVFLGQLSGTVVAAVLMAVYLRKELIFQWSRLEFKKMMQYSLPLVPAIAGSWADSYVSRFVMLGYLSVTEIGLYAVALKFASVVLLIDTALRMAWATFMWETYENNPDHKEVFVRVQKDLSTFVLFVVLLLALFSKEIILVFTSASYIGAAKLIGAISLSMAINGVIMQLTGIGPAITKKTHYNMLIYFLGLAINIGSLFIFVPLFGLIGVTVSLLVGNLAFLIAGWYNSEKLYHVGFNKLSMSLNILLTLSVIILCILFDLSLGTKILLAIVLIFIVVNKYKEIFYSLLKRKALWG